MGRWDVGIIENGGQVGVVRIGLEMGGMGGFRIYREQVKLEKVDWQGILEFFIEKELVRTFQMERDK